MGDVLSQNEIDALLNALSSGELDVDEIKENGEKQVKDYDFARPSKFSKEHLRTLEIIFEHYGRLLSTNLPVYLRKNVQIEVMNSEAVTYQEFSNALSNPVLLGIVNFAPLQGSIILAGCVMAYVLKTDYSYYGIVLVAIFYFYRNNRFLACVVGYVWFTFEPWCFPAFIAVMFYGGKRGIRLKYFFYAFYPAHLLLLYGLRVLLIGN